VTGLIGSGLVLQNNGGDDLSVATNGDFKFSANITSGDGYSVTVQAQPGSPSQDCLVVGSSGTVTDHEISSVNISCSTYQVGVTVTGLVSGETLTLQNNGGDDLLITGNGGPFVFNTLIHDFLPYDVTVSSQPVTSTQQCMVVNGAGTIPSTDVLDIVIVCPNVEALYPDNGANWNDYVNNNGGNGFAADDTPCNGVGNSYNDCLHGGEMRAVVLEGVSSCANVSADDDLDALNWHCDDSTGTARVISTSLTSTAALSSLIDFSSTQWKENAVNIYQFGVPVAKTPTGKWWTNSLSVANAGGSLDSESVIYLVTANPASDYTIDANKVGLVIQPGLSISGDGSDDVVYAKGPAYLWIEGAIDAGGNANGVFWENVTSSVMKDVHVRDSAFANNITLFNSSNNALKSIRVSGAISHGLYLENSHYNTVVDVLAADNQNAGIYITGSNNNRFLGSTTVNNDNGGNADGSGILMSGSTDNTFVNVTVANNKLSGLTLNMSGNNVMQNVVATNNYTSLLLLDNASNNTAANIVAVNNSRRGMLLRDVNNNYFTGLLKVGNNASSDCAVQGTNIAPGLVDISCSDSGANGSITYTGQQSDALLKTGVSIANSVVGKVVIDDNANQSDLNGGAMYTGITDWWSFENKFRVWALDGDPFPSLTHKGPLPLCENYVAFDETDCLSNGGTWRPDARIWDWSLAQDDDGDNGDAVLMGVLYLPQGDNVITHEWSNATSSTFLRNAVEVIGDGVGNDDGLCNSNETCLHTSNIGAYQGHGKLVPAGTFVDSGSGGVTGVRLLQYEINGY
jgi:parallel beta-helix repeat protein